MLAAFDSRTTKLCQLAGDYLELFEVSGELPRRVASQKISEPKLLAGCSRYVAVLTGKISAGGSSVKKAVVARFDWDLNPLSSLSVGEVEKRGLSFSADGKRLVVTDWKTCHVTLIDAEGGAAIAAGGDSIPSGASLSPDGKSIVAGTADQGDGDLLFFDTGASDGKHLPHEELPKPKKTCGLDDAPYFSVWSPDGKLAAISNQSWGGRGVYVYSFPEKKALWSVAINADEGESEPEEWFAEPMAFALGGAILLVAEPGKIRGYRARDGKSLGTITVENGDGSCGFAVQDAMSRVWVPGETPKAYAFSPKWVPKG